MIYLTNSDVSASVYRAADQLVRMIESLNYQASSFGELVSSFGEADVAGYADVLLTAEKKIDQLRHSLFGVSSNLMALRNRRLAE